MQLFYWFAFVDRTLQAVRNQLTDLTGNQFRFGSVHNLFKTLIQKTCYFYTDFLMGEIDEGALGLTGTHSANGVSKKSAIARFLIGAIILNHARCILSDYPCMSNLQCPTSCEFSFKAAGNVNKIKYFCENFYC